MMEHVCFACGRPAARWDGQIGKWVCEGNPDCAISRSKKKKPYTPPKLTHYGNLRPDTKAVAKGMSHDSHIGRLHKTA